MSFKLSDLLKQVQSLPQQFAAIPQLFNQTRTTPAVPPPPKISLKQSLAAPVKVQSSSAQLTPKTQAIVAKNTSNFISKPVVQNVIKAPGQFWQGFSADPSEAVNYRPNEAAPTQIGKALTNLANSTPFTAGAVGGIRALPKVAKVAQTTEKLPLLTKLSKGEQILKDIEKGFQLGREAKTTIKTTAGPTLSKLRTEVIDKLTPVYDLVQQGVKKLPAEQNPYIRMRNFAGLSGKVNSYLQQNLKPILDTSKGNLPDLSTLLTLDRYKEIGTNGKITPYNTGQINAGIDALTKKLGPQGFSQLQQSANQVRDYGRNLLTMLKDSGIIDQKSFDAISKNHTMYVPFQVVDYIAENINKGNYARSSFNVASQDVIKSMTGTTKAIGDPLEALIERTAKVLSISEKNQAMQSLVNLRTIDPLYEDLIQPVKNVVPKGMEKISLFENGKNVDYAVIPEVATAIKNLDKQQANLLTTVLGWQGNLLREGATGLNMAFIPANVVRDIGDALHAEASEKGIRGAIDLVASYPQAIAQAIGKGELYQQWLQSGGGQAGFTTAYLTKNTPKTLNELSGNTNVIQKTLKANPISLIRFLGRVGEESTRLARFNAGLKRGETPLEAAFKSRDITIDFSKSGNSIRLLNQVVPFFNAALQGSERFFRLIKNNPKQALASLTILSGVPSALIFNHNRQFQDYQDIPQYERDGNFIIIARDRTPEEKAAGNPIVGIKIPKPFYLQPTSNMTEAFLRYVNKTDPQSLGSFLQSISGGLTPVPLGQEALSTVTPPLLRAGLQSAANYDFFRQAPIVPQNLQGVTPSEQFRENTPEIYKQFGKLTGTSPLKAENFVQTTTGGLGSQVGQLLSGNPKAATVDQIKNRFVNIKQGEQTNKFYEETNKLKQESMSNSLQKSREAERLHQEFKSLPREEANSRIREIQQSDPALYKKIKAIAEEDKKGLTAEDKKIISLPVKDGTRAKYIDSQARKFKTPTERNLYIDQLKRKKVITDEVLSQLKVLNK